MKTTLKCSLICFCLLLAALFVFTGTAQAQLSDLNPPTEDDTLDCRECHWGTYLDWEQSVHGVGLSCGQCHLADQDNHARSGHGAQEEGAAQCMPCHTTGYNPENDTWEEDNIHCKACHSPINLNHPDEPMPTDRSAELCGGCHIEAHIEWQESAHQTAGVTCINCHSQHRTALKNGGVTEQCSACHDNRVDMFTHSEHQEAGVLCGDCHLALIEGPIGEGSAKRNHTFSVELGTCLSCHEDQLHYGPADTAQIENSPDSETVDAMVSNVDVEVSSEPKSINLVNFIPLLGFAGIVLGMVYRPKIDSWLQRIRNHDQGGPQ